MRYLLFLSVFATTFTLLSQERLQLSPEFMKSVDWRPPVGIIDRPLGVESQGDAVPRSANFLNQETILGTTIYDLQTNASVQNRFVMTPDGRRAAVWIHTLERDGTEAFTDRGTGYNYFNGVLWQEMPSERLESLRVGWPSISLLDDDRVHIVTHTGASVLHTVTMDIDGSNLVESDIPDNTPFGLLWPRSAASGQMVHVIGLTTPVSQMGTPYEGIDGKLLYHRSSDGGETWDIINFSIPELDTTHYRFIPPDAYAVEASDDIVAIAIFASWGDILLFKSLDAGLTWSKIIVNDFPLDGYEMDDGYDISDLPEDPNAPDSTAIYTSNGAGNMVIDAQGVIHLTYADGYVADRDTTDGQSSIFPGVAGISYWNDQTEGQPIFVGGLLDANVNGTFDLMDGQGVIPRYTNHTLTSMPTISLDNNGGIIIVYSSLSEANFNELDEEHYRHLFAVKSLDNGITWGPPYDMINIDLIDEDFYEFVEAVYPSAAKTFDDTLFLIYQQDFFPGHTFDDDTNDPQADNFITQFALPIDLVLDASALAIDEPSISDHLRVFPTVTSGIVSVQVQQYAITNYGLRVFDLMGRQVLNKSNQVGDQQVNLSSLASGSYFIHVRSAEGIATFKILRQ